ncbi:MAG TPA: amino acid adenylation domain-containing protein [Streptosporangiaceae bacterium]
MTNPVEDPDAWYRELAAGELTLPALFEAQVLRAPDAVAVVCGDVAISYGELEERANRLARHLVSLGAGPERLVAVAMERSADLVVVLLAVLKAGAAYLPVDPRYPADRIAFMLEDAGPVLLVCDQATAEVLPGTGVLAVVVDGPECAAVVAGLSGAALGDADRAGPLVPGHPAYVIFTSGSTGRPKGVVVEHRNVVRLITQTRQWVPAGPGDAWSLFHSYAFDFSVWEMWGALATGGRLVVVPYLVSRSAAEFRALLAAERVSVLSQTPMAFYQLMEVWGDGAGLSVRYVIFGGEALDCARVARWARTVPDPPVLVNMYGITETTVHVTGHVVPDGTEAAASVVGTAIPDLRVYVLDERLKPVPRGVGGEMYVAGAGLARGYLARPGLTAERFLACPYGTAGERMYRTGDLARWNRAGDLEYLGRSDDQVKIRGFRIELGEIETVLAAQSGVAQAAVIAREDQPGDIRLAGYVVPAAGSELNPATLRDAIARVLPDYMVPAAIMALAALPLSPTGKLDRKALPAPDYGAGAGRGREPETEQERALCAVFAQVLGLDKVGVEDSFFVLGGHSLLATRLVSRIRTVLRVEIPIRAVFEHPTVAALAQVVDAAEAARPPLVPMPRPERVPLSFAQQRLWFLEQLNGPGTAYNLAFAWELRGELDTSALTAALGDVIARHEALRTVFAVADEQPYQRVVPAGQITVPATVRAVERADVAGLVDTAVRYVFDLAAELPVRAWVFTVAADEHVLVLLCHHIASDGWSVQVMTADLAVAYAARRDGRAPGWADLPVQYADYALWQHQLLGSGQDAGSVMARQVGYWRDALAGVPEQLELPYDRPRPAGPLTRGGEVVAELDGGLHAALGALAREHQASVFMVLHAALAALLSRMGAGTDIPLGSPVAGRTDEAVHDLVGFFVNTVVLRADVSGDPEFGELVDRIRETDLAAYAHQDVPFEHLVEVLNPARSPGRHPLFQAMIISDDQTSRPWQVPGLRTTLWPLSTDTAKFDLSCMFQQQYQPDGSPGRINCMFEYAVDVFDHDTVRDLAGRLTGLLRQAVADPGRRVGEFELLTREERDQLLGPAQPAPSGQNAVTVAEQFQDQVARTPDAVAVVSGDVRLSYAELNRRANRLARYLVTLGAGPERLVAVAMPRSAEMVMAVLAVVKTGAAYVPVDPAYPADRIAYMLADAAPVAVLSTTETSPGLPDQVAQVVTDNPATVAKITQRADADLDDAERVGPLALSAAAYAIYTSGSTGRPKGVVVEHRAVAALLSWARGEFTGAELSRVLAATSLSFDVSVFELFAPLVSGGSIEVVRDLLALADRDRPWQGSLICAVPSALTGVLSVHGATALAETVLLAGEALTARAMAAVRAALPGARVRNVYGPTEAAVYSTAWLAPADAPADAPAGTGNPPIGRPVGAMRAFVLDERLVLVPPGVAGELYLAGTNLARGYLGEPGLTGERFVACPFGAAGERMYRTGDLARWSAADQLEYLGRVDDQVKIRGFRVELGEIEAVLAAQPGVERSAVSVRQDRPGDAILVGYVVPVPGHQLDPAGLRDAAAAALPGYMVPAAVVVLDRLPLNPNGKLDRRALPAPEYATGSARTEPATAGERALCTVFAQVLGLDQVGVEDSFFDLGGHSLLATRLVARIRTVLGVEVPVRAVFEHPTVAALARMTDDAETARPLLRRAQTRPERVPLSFAQQRLWFLEQFHGPGTAYNLPLAWRLRGQLDAGALTTALNDVAGRHEALRTVFAVEGGQPYQRVIPAGEAVIPVTVQEAGQNEVTGLVDAAARYEFDLAAELPVRAWVFTVAADEHVLVLLCHHIASDGWSVQVLMRDLAAAYAARRDGRAPDWAPLPVQYADYTLWQRDLLGSGDVAAGGVLTGQIEYWKRALAGLPEELALPFDRRRPAELSPQGGAVSWQLADAGLHAALAGLAREQQASVFMVLHAGLVALLSRMGAGTDVPVGAAVAGRTDEVMHDLVGFFVNTLVLRADLSGEPGFADLVGRVRETVLAAQARQDVPFERLVEVLNPVRSQSRHPLFQVMIADQDVTAAEWDLPGLTAVGLPVPDLSAKFDLLLAFKQTWDENGAPAGITGLLEFPHDLFDPETVRDLAGRLTRLLAQAVADPARPVSSLDVLTNAERYQLAEWNRTGRDIQTVMLPELIAATTGRVPDATAVIDGPVTLSHAELNARANRLARLLIARGAGPERFVAVALPRSADMIIAVLAIVKTGAAYVPVDPAYPADRIGYMLTETSPVTVLTTAEVAVSLPGGLPLLHLDDPATVRDLAGRSADDLGVRIDPSSAAYVIYTSGSTGRPKGVVIEHGSAALLARWTEAEFTGAELSRVLASTSLSFDVSVFEIFGTLTAGGAIQIVSNLLALTAGPWQGSMISAVPTALAHVLAAPGTAATAAVVALCGEAVTGQVLAGIRAALPHARIVNLYGPAEGTVFATTSTVPGTMTGAPLIGRPIWNRRAYILDERLQLVPPGVAGELYLVGGLARGYQGRARLTAERFTACPYEAAGERMYRTGDLARWTRDGQLDYLGRADDQVKIRGFRVEPGEIETVLAAQPGVGQVRVILREDQPGDKRLAGYVVPAAGTELDPAVLREAAARVLPGYMVPAAIVIMDKLPLTANSKLDRRALPAPDYGAGAALQEPATDTERALCALFAQVLGIDQVGVEDSFFDLGGHSLLATVLVARLVEQTGVKVSLKDFMGNPTVRAVGRYLDQ